MGTPNRLRLYGAEADVASALPRGARVLLHEIQMHVGINARVVNDQWQGRIAYLTWQSPAVIYRELLPFKLTHLLWNADASGWNSVGADLAFLGFASNYAEGATQYGGMKLAAFPSKPPPDGSFNDRVVVLACGNPYPNGVYPLRTLTVPAEGQPWATPEGPVGDVAAAVARAGFLAVQPECAPPLPPDVAAQFHGPVRRGPYNLYARKLGTN